MTKRVVTFIECDICGERAETFDEWKPYATDLCETHMKEIVEPLREHLQTKGTRTGSKKSSSSKKSSAGGDREVRDWARSQGIEVGPRGRVPSTVHDAFAAAH
jgi:hypothetical protein